MPYYHGPRLSKTDPPTHKPTNSPTDQDAQAVVSAIIDDWCHGLDFLANWPVKFSSTTESTSPGKSTRVLHNAELPLAPRQLDQFNWAVYSFNNGNFVSSICSYNLSFKIVLASDPFTHSHALFSEFKNFRSILSGAKELLDHIRGLDQSSKLHGYIIHSH